MRQKKYTSLLFDLDDTLFDYSGEEIRTALTVLKITHYRTLRML